MSGVEGNPQNLLDLHSNMVRFIIRRNIIRYRQLNIIYIPIWLDLLLIIMIFSLYEFVNLHSNMVRFIIR